MKKNLLILAAVMMGVAGCETWNNDDSDVMSDPAGAENQSRSSDVNPSSSSRDVGQSGAITDESDAPADDTETENPNRRPQTTTP